MTVAASLTSVPVTVGISTLICNRPFKPAAGSWDNSIHASKFQTKALFPEFKIKQRTEFGWEL